MTEPITEFLSRNHWECGDADAAAEFTTTTEAWDKIMVPETMFSGLWLLTTQSKWCNKRPPPLNCRRCRVCRGL